MTSTPDPNSDGVFAVGVERVRTVGRHSFPASDRTEEERGLGLKVKLRLKAAKRDGARSHSPKVLKSANDARHVV